MGQAALTVELLIDGRPATSSSAWWQHQDDPYPGGHQYWLRVSGPGHRRRLKGVVPGYNLDKNATNHVFGALHWAGVLWPQPGAEPAWVLNTIDVLDMEDDSVTLEGVCSHFVRQQAGATGQEPPRAPHRQQSNRPKPAEHL